MDWLCSEMPLFALAAQESWDWDLGVSQRDMSVVSSVEAVLQGNCGYFLFLYIISNEML